MRIHLLLSLIGITCTYRLIFAFKTYAERVKSLRSILSQNDLTTMPCCYDGLTARLIENAGFNITFMTGFGVSATFGLPDTGLLGAEEMLQSASKICSTLQNIPCIGDGDTGYGNPINVKRTVARFIF
jgi:2-methylisocitrate lyase-like PEP mutase family enzyme